MSFSTLPGGHLFYPGAISFSASQAGNGMVSFNINLSGNFNGVINGAKYYLGGSAFENAQWHETASTLQGAAPCGRACKGLSLRIEGVEPFEVRKALGEEGN